MRKGKQLRAEAIMLEFWGEVGSWAAVGDAIGLLLEDLGLASAAAPCPAGDSRRGANAPSSAGASAAPPSRRLRRTGSTARAA